MVFPTHVGVYRILSGLDAILKRFPHTRGGVPAGGIRYRVGLWVFPTHVGVYLSR